MTSGEFLKNQPGTPDLEQLKVEFTTLFEDLTPTEALDGPIIRGEYSKKQGIPKSILPEHIELLTLEFEKQKRIRDWIFEETDLSRRASKLTVASYDITNNPLRHTETINVLSTDQKQTISIGKLCNDFIHPYDATAEVLQQQGFGALNIVLEHEKKRNNGQGIHNHIEVIRPQNTSNELIDRFLIQAVSNNIIPAQLLISFAGFGYLQDDLLALNALIAQNKQLRTDRLLEAAYRVIQKTLVLAAPETYSRMMQHKTVTRGDDVTVLSFDKIALLADVSRKTQVAALEVAPDTETDIEKQERTKLLTKQRCRL